MTKTNILVEKNSVKNKGGENMYLRFGGKTNGNVVKVVFEKENEGFIAGSIKFENGEFVSLGWGTHLMLGGLELDKNKYRDFKLPAIVFNKTKASDETTFKAKHLFVAVAKKIYEANKKQIIEFLGEKEAQEFSFKVKTGDHVFNLSYMAKDAKEAFLIMRKDCTFTFGNEWEVVDGEVREKYVFDVRIEDEIKEKAIKANSAEEAFKKLERSMALVGAFNLDWFVEGSNADKEYICTLENKEETIFIELEGSCKYEVQGVLMIDYPEYEVVDIDVKEVV